MFVALYTFTVKAGSEDKFRDAWGCLTEAIFATHGSRGSRLHFGEGGIWFAYAQWPSREVWEQARAQPSANAEASADMRECLAGPIETLLGEVCDDLLR